MCKYNPELGDTIEYAAERLPAGWTVALCVEEGSAFVRLEGPDGECVPLETAYLTLDQEVLHAVAVAGMRVGT